MNRRISLCLVVVAVLLSAVGCGDAEVDREKLEQRATADAVAELAMSTFAEGATPAPDVRPKPGEPCTPCGGTGRVGDGRVSQTCLDCEGTGVVPEPKAAVPADEPKAAVPADETRSKSPKNEVPKNEVRKNDVPKLTARPSSSSWTRSTITVCHGTYCTRIAGQLHAGGQWFIDDASHWYRRRGQHWTPHPGPTPRSSRVARTNVRAAQPQETE